MTSNRIRLASSSSASRGPVLAELERIARITARTDDDPRRVLRTAAGWELFNKNLCEESRSFRAGRNRTLGPGGAQRHRSLRPLLVLDVLADDLKRCAAAGSGEVRG
ncbi:hypothetical protein GCM10009525_79400 [Streptosporangium amethystogenes subsp. fukuiense]